MACEDMSEPDLQGTAIRYAVYNKAGTRILQRFPSKTLAKEYIKKLKKRNKIEAN
jgi:hypothetical protein